jgi:hypothetical protein
VINDNEVDYPSRGGKKGPWKDRQEGSEKEEVVIGWRSISAIRCDSLYTNRWRFASSLDAEFMPTRLEAMEAKHVFEMPECARAMDGFQQVFADFLGTEWRERSLA